MRSTNFPCARAILADAEGASAIEYALLAALIGLGIVTSLGDLGREVSGGLNKAGKELGSGGPGNGNQGNGNGNGGNGNGNGNGNGGN